MPRRSDPFTAAIGLCIEILQTMNKLGLQSPSVSNDILKAQKLLARASALTGKDGING